MSPKGGDTSKGPKEEEPQFFIYKLEFLHWSRCPHHKITTYPARCLVNRPSGTHLNSIFISEVVPTVYLPSTSSYNSYLPPQTVPITLPRIYHFNNMINICKLADKLNIKIFPFFLLSYKIVQFDLINKLKAVHGVIT